MSLPTTLLASRCLELGHITLLTWEVKGFYLVLLLLLFYAGNIATAIKSRFREQERTEGGTVNKKHLYHVPLLFILRANYSLVIPILAFDPRAIRKKRTAFFFSLS